MARLFIRLLLKPYLSLHTASLFYFLARHVYLYTFARQKIKCLALFCESGFQKKSIIVAFFLFSFEVFAVEQNAPEIDAYNQEVEKKEDIINLYTDADPMAFKPKKATPARFFAAELSMPDQFFTSNNLTKKPGAFYRAFGEVIFVQGNVVDSFGVPIEGAIIEIWQANSAGKYHSLLEPNSEYIDKYFNMSGRTITDNLGNYHFITVMPGSTPGRAPHVNINIYHTKFGKLETEMYFENHPFNDKDYQYLSYEEDERKMLTAVVHHSDIYDTKSIKVCTFNLVMRGIHQYKKY